MTEIVSTQTPPILHGPSEKERKYDRQLRLWAASGQAALESSNILLVNSGSGTVGVETLKNLVLPGIGRFTVADDATVSKADLGVNFFLDESSLGKSRAQCCAELLVELNPEVGGDWYPENKEPLNLESVLANTVPYTIILYTLPIRPDRLEALEAYGRQHKTPLVAVHSAGFYSYFRVSLHGAFPIVDTHPDETATTDLRLLTPWPELTAFAKDMTANIDNLDTHEHGHLPYVVILLHYLDVWKQSHDGAYPSNYAEKVAFRKMVSEAARTDNPEGGEENFEEAVAAVLKTVSPPSLPDSVKQVFEYQHVDPDETKSGFWIIADAVKKFYEKHRCLPVPGGLPDMKAQSGVYIKLQAIYKAKARQDAAEVLELVRSVPGGDLIDPAEVDTFCKNAAFIKLIDSPEGGQDRLREVADEELANDELASQGILPASLLPIYLALNATSHAVMGEDVQGASASSSSSAAAAAAGEKSTSATSPEDNTTMTTRTTTATSSAVASGAELSPDVILSDVARLVPEAARSERYQQAAQEVARAAAGELHNVSAVMGGMVAQEMIKIITKQYIPINNTCVFDGIASRCQVLRL